MLKLSKAALKQLQKEGFEVLTTQLRNGSLKFYQDPAGLEEVSKQERTAKPEKVIERRIRNQRPKHESTHNLDVTEDQLPLKQVR